MRTADVITASLLMAIGGIVLVDAVRLGFRWGTDGPESGFFPFLLATILVVSCAVIIVRAATSKSSKAFATRQQLALVLKVLLPAGGMVLLTQFIGLYVAAVLYMAFYMRWVGKHSWPTTVLLPLMVSLLTFVVFEKFFLVPLPKGPLETWLGY
jgi:putative tricarboxylic transport membrane protein